MPKEITQRVALSLVKKARDSIEARAIVDRSGDAPCGMITLFFRVDDQKGTLSTEQKPEDLLTYLAEN